MAKQLTKKEYVLCKALQEAGVGVGKAKDVVGRSYNTINYIYQSKDMEDYINQRKARYEARKLREGKTTKPEIVEEQVEEKVLMDSHNQIVAQLKAIEYQIRETNEILRSAV